MKTFGILCLVAVVLFGIGFGIYLWRCDWIKAGWCGAMYNPAKGLDRQHVLNPRRHYVPWRHQIYQMPTMVRAAVYTEDPSAGEEKSADSILMTTNDNANTKFDLAIFYHIDKKHLSRAFDAFGVTKIEDIQSNQIRAAAREVANDISTEYSVFELMGPKRKEASDRMTKGLQDRLLKKGITIQHVLICACHPDINTREKIVQRVNSLTDLSIAKIKQEIAEIRRQKAIILAEANATAARLKSSQTGEKSIEILSLNSDIEAAKKWDGHLSPLSSSRGQNIVLSVSDLAALTGRGNN